jgi:cytochrome P450
MSATLSLPPGPKGSPLAGSLKPFSDRRLDWLVEIARTYGPLCSFRLGPRRCLLVSDPDLIEQVLVTDYKKYVKHFGARLYKPLLGNGLVTSAGSPSRRSSRPGCRTTPRP